MKNNNINNISLSYFLNNDKLINQLCEKINFNEIVKYLNSHINKPKNNQIEKENNQINKENIKKIKVIIDYLESLDKIENIEKKKIFIRKLFNTNLNSSLTIDKIKEILISNDKSNTNSNINKIQKIKLYCNKNNITNKSTNNNKCFKLTNFNDNKIKNLIKYLRIKFLSNVDSCLIINYDSSLPLIDYIFPSDRIFIKNMNFDLKESNIINIIHKPLIEHTKNIMKMMKVIKILKNPIQSGGNSENHERLQSILLPIIYASYCLLFGFILMPIIRFILSLFRSKAKDKRDYVINNMTGHIHNRTLANNYNNLFIPYYTGLK